MASGDIPNKDPFSTIGNGISSISNGIGDFASLFRGSSSSNNQSTNQNINITNTSEEDVSEEKAKAYLEKLLNGNEGLAAITSMQKASGIYDATATAQLTNDLLGSVVANVAALSKKVTTNQSGTVTNDTTTQQKKKGALQWIVCTELYQQGRLPHKYYRYGAKVFAAHDDRIKQGYYLWAVPLVKHLRKKPQSIISAIAQDVFTARAEYLAAQAGCKDARKTVAGFIVTYGLIAMCWTLSRTIARKPIDWYSEVYKGV